MQLDTEEGQNFVPPAGVVASSQPASTGDSQVPVEPQVRGGDELDAED
jgi:hypothetical protein